MNKNRKDQNAKNVYFSYKSTQTKKTSCAKSPKIVCKNNTSKWVSAVMFVQ